MNRYWFLLCFCCISETSISQQLEQVKKVLSEFSYDSLEIEVKRLTGEIPVSVDNQSQIIYSRMAEKEGNELAFQYMKELFIKLELDIESHDFSFRGKNLLGIKYGTLYPGRVCIIGAHYDNFPLTTIAPGADDNASGCAAVLEAARILSKYDFPNTIIFALWDEEELGLIGSNAYAQKTKLHVDSLIGYINLDMIGWDENNDNKTEVHTRSISNSQNLKQIVINCNELYEIGLSLEVVDPASGNTDHASFWKYGYSAVGISEEYIGDFNSNWHKVSDSLIHFDSDYFASNSKLALATLTTLALSTADTTEKIGNAILFPNPSKNHVTIQLGKLLTDPVQIKIADDIGRIVFYKVYDNDEFIKIDEIEHLNGFFTVEIISGDYSKMLTLIRL